jgi:hypothetical protein
MSLSGINGIIELVGGVLIVLGLFKEHEAVDDSQLTPV